MTGKQVNWARRVELAATKMGKWFNMNEMFPIFQIIRADRVIVVLSAYPFLAAQMCPSLSGLCNGTWRTEAWENKNRSNETKRCTVNVSLFD